jgi:hypothetical protein
VDILKLEIFYGQQEFEAGFHKICWCSEGSHPLELFDVSSV